MGVDQAKAVRAEEAHAAFLGRANDGLLTGHPIPTDLRELRRDDDADANPGGGAVADRVHGEICRHAVDPKGGHFTQAYGSRRLDASLLLLAIVGFLPPDDPRLVKTVAAIEKRLVVEGLVLRYETDRQLDGLPKGEGAFLACSFWLADNYCLMGRLEEGRALFRRLVGLCNDVGLLAEEYDPRAKRFLGNFPQAFSHVALVNTAYGLKRAEGARVGAAGGARRRAVARHDRGREDGDKA